MDLGPNFLLVGVRFCKFCAAEGRPRGFTRYAPAIVPIINIHVPLLNNICAMEGTLLWICASKCMGLGPNFVPVRLGVSWCIPSRGVHFRCDTPSPPGGPIVFFFAFCVNRQLRQHTEFI